MRLYSSKEKKSEIRLTSNIFAEVNFIELIFHPPRMEYLKEPGQSIFYSHVRILANSKIHVL